jgi:hypothetical protein
MELLAGLKKHIWTEWASRNDFNLTLEKWPAKELPQLHFQGTAASKEQWLWLLASGPDHLCHEHEAAELGKSPLQVLDSESTLHFQDTC